MAAITPVAADMVQSGDRSFSLSFASTGVTDTLAASAVADLLTEGSAIQTFMAAANALNDFRDESVNVSLISSVTGSAVAFNGTAFVGFAAGNHVLRISLSYSASA